MRGVAWGVGSATNQTQDGGLETFPQERMPELCLKKPLQGGLRPEGKDLRQVGSTRQCRGGFFPDDHGDSLEDSFIHSVSKTLPSWKD